MSTRVRIAVIAAVLLTAAVTGFTVLLPTAAHAAEATRVAHSDSSDGTNAGVLAWGAAAFIGTGLVLMIGISRHGRHRH
ncbi:hypothetical protein EDD99_4357 [Streptomyces sp. 846.5]|jgi:hypothetical protein|nr:hypothetical protein [Streptomyces sp. 846.5]TDU05824.1 hypothetical protein EDD99_4357 [Streptomyces sp. 846.5]